MKKRESVVPPFPVLCSVFRRSVFLPSAPLRFKPPVACRPHGPADGRGRGGAVEAVPGGRPRGRRCPARSSTSTRSRPTSRAVTAPLRASGKTLRIATKSVRCPDLVGRIREAAGAVARGLMTYTARRDRVLGRARRARSAPRLPHRPRRPTPTRSRAPTRPAPPPPSSSTASRAPRRSSPPPAERRRHDLPVVLEVDVSWRPLGAASTSASVAARCAPPTTSSSLARPVAPHRGPALPRRHGLRGADRRRAGRRRRRSALMKDRLRLRRGARRAPPSPRGSARRWPHRSPLFNGGGTGTLAACAREPALTEVTAGSGFLDSHLFDGYRGLCARSPPPTSRSRSSAARRRASSRATAAATSRRAAPARSPPHPRAAPRACACSPWRARARCRRRSTSRTAALRSRSAIPSSSATPRPASSPSTSRSTCWCGATASRRAPPTYRGLGQCFLG